MLSLRRLLDNFFAKRAFRKYCSCQSNPLETNRDGVEEVYIGCDKTNGRFADVTARSCPYCRFAWLRYQVAYEGFSHSGRWYYGRIPVKQLSLLKPEEAVSWLEKSNPCFYGGSYYETEGRFLQDPRGNIHVDL